MDDEENARELKLVESVQDKAKVVLTHHRPRSLRFATTGSKLAPQDYLNLDKALHQLGQWLCSEPWNRVLSLKEMPFQYESRKKRFFQYRLAPQSEGYALRKKQLTPKTLAERRALRDADRVYKKVRIEMMRAIEENKISAKILTPDFDIVDIPAKGIWVGQMRAIFYTGYMRVRSNDSVKRCRILVNKRDLLLFIKEKEAFSQFKVNKKANLTATSAANLRRVLPIVVSHAQKQGYTLTQKWLRDVFLDAAKSCGVKISKKLFDSQIWQDFALADVRVKHGRPPKTQVDKRNIDKPEMQKIVEHWLTHSNPT